MAIKVSFWREGYANNSSSSHSLIWTSKIKGVKDSGDKEFGWNLFTCSSKESKQKYMLICLYEAYSSASKMPFYNSIILPETIRDFVGKCFLEWVEVNFTSLHGVAQEMDFESQYIDHQSVIVFPCYRKSEKGINIEFAEAFMSEFINGNYAMLGGNDNDDKEHKFSHLNEKENNLLEKIYKLIRDVIPGSMLCEKDNKIGDFVLSSNNKGDIVRISFEAVPVEKKDDHDEIADKTLEMIGEGK